MQVDGHLKHTGFLDLLTDVLFHLRVSTEKSGLSENKHARAAIISCALSLESSANCLLSSLELPIKTSKELEKLPPLTKMDTALRLRTQGEVELDRGDNRVAKMKDLITLRNDFVHQKQRVIPADCTMTQNPEEIRVSFDSKSCVYQNLRVSKIGSEWSSGDAEEVAKAAFDFFDLIFRKLLLLDETDAQILLGDSKNMGPGEGGMKLSIIGLDADCHSLLDWARERKLAVEFLRSA